MSEDPMSQDPDPSFQRWYRRQRLPLQAAPPGLAAGLRARLRPAPSAPPRLAWGLGFALALLIGFGAGWGSAHLRGGQTMVFRLAAPGARQVALAASFAEWKPKAMRRQGDDWVIEMRVPEGRHQYAFVVNGHRWLPDPDRAEAELAADGQVHSVLDVGTTRSL